MFNIKRLVKNGTLFNPIRFLVPCLLAVGLFVVGCQDAITDSGSDSGRNMNSASLDNHNAIGKKGGNGGGKPGRSTTFPSSVSINVVELVAGSVNHLTSPWFDDTFMLLSTLSTSTHSFTTGETPVGLNVGTPEAFFGCVDSSKPCYEITVVAQDAEPNDLVYVKPLPMVRSNECTSDTFGDLCAHDDRFGIMARTLSLFDDFRGTPIIPFSEFASNKTFVFY